MDLPGLRPVPPVRVLVVGWGSCLADVTDLTNLQLAISTAVAAAGGAHADLELVSDTVGRRLGRDPAKPSGLLQHRNTLRQ